MTIAMTNMALAQSNSSGNTTGTQLNLPHPQFKYKLEEEIVLYHILYSVLKPHR